MTSDLDPTQYLHQPWAREHLLQNEISALRQELLTLRADSALVVYALDCALALINGLILFLPDGMVQPPELGGMKQQLDDAMAKIRRREAEPAGSSRVVPPEMGRPMGDEFETAVVLKTRALETEITRKRMDMLLDEKTAEIARLTRAHDIAYYNAAELGEQKVMLTKVLTDAITLVDYMIGELRNNNVVPSAALQIAHNQFNEKMRKLFKLNQAQ